MVITVIMGVIIAMIVDDDSMARAVFAPVPEKSFTFVAFDRLPTQIAQDR